MADESDFTPTNLPIPMEDIPDYPTNDEEYNWKKDRDVKKAVTGMGGEAGTPEFTEEIGQGYERAKMSGGFEEAIRNLEVE